MHKRIIIPILLIVSLLLSSCTYTVTVKEKKLENKNTNKSNAVKIDTSKLADDVDTGSYEPIKLTNGYDLLDADEQTVYDAVVAHSADFTDVPNTEGDRKNYEMQSFEIVGSGITRRQLAKVMKAVNLDNPGFFWIDEPYAYSFTGDNLSIQLYSTMTSARFKKASRQLNAVVNSILSGLDEGMTDFELERYFHDYIVKNCIYDKKADSTSSRNPYSAYGCLVQQNAVCSGYTDAMQLLLSYVGVNSITVSGTDSETNHIWNALSLDDDWYYIDVTWDDTDELHMYDYFNITSAELMKTHEASPLLSDIDDYELFGDDGTLEVFNLIVPDCTATEYNYFVQTGSLYGGEDNNTLSDDLAAAANRNESYFYIIVDVECVSVDDAYNQLFSQDSYGFADYIDRANSTAGGVLDTSVSVYRNENGNTFTVVLNYK